MNQQHSSQSDFNLYLYLLARILVADTNSSISLCLWSGEVRGESMEYLVEHLSHLKAVHVYLAYPPPVRARAQTYTRTYI